MFLVGFSTTFPIYICDRAFGKDGNNNTFRIYLDSFTISKQEKTCLAEKDDELENGN